jgi:hypothetical protein
MIMHELVLRIRKPELCYVFARNAISRGREDLAVQAYRRAVDLRAEIHCPESETELMALKAFYAYEEAMSYGRARRRKATGSWQLVNRLGVLEALRRRADSRYDAEALPILRELQMADYAFHAVAALTASPDREAEQAA